MVALTPADLSQLAAVETAARAMIERLARTGSGNFQQPVKAFQISWNNARSVITKVPAAVFARLTPDGKYGKNTAGALAQLLPATAPPPTRAYQIPTWYAQHGETVAAMGMYRPPPDPLPPPITGPPMPVPVPARSALDPPQQVVPAPPLPIPQPPPPPPRPPAAVPAPVAAPVMAPPPAPPVAVAQIPVIQPSMPVSPGPAPVIVVPVPAPAPPAIPAAPPPVPVQRVLTQPGAPIAIIAPSAPALIPDTVPPAAPPIRLPPAKIVAQPPKGDAPFIAAGLGVLALAGVVTTLLVRRKRRR